MRTRILVVLALLAALHAYIGWRVIPDMPVGIGVQLACGLWLLASLVLIPIGLLSRRADGHSAGAERAAWAGLIALGMISSLFVLTLLRDVLLLAAAIAGFHSGKLVADSALAVPLIAAAVTLVGFVNARRVARVVHVDVPIDGLPEALHGFTIAQISDIHVGPTIKRDYLDAIVERVNALQADAVAVTGDLVDGRVHHLAEHTAPLAKLQSRHGAFFVTGNHEYYSNAHEWIVEVERLGLHVLMNEHVVLNHEGEKVLMAGVTDYTAHHFDPSHKSDPHRAAAGAPANVGVKILLAHQPRTAQQAADAGFDLQLSGHTHGGQFFPWNLFVPMQQPYVAGLKRLKQLWIYISRGTGYWGPPKRFGAPSEITRLRLVRGE
jgi:hypothetical protein